MNLETVKTFLDQHSNWNTLIQGGTTDGGRSLLEADWREKYQVREREAEYLAMVDLGKGTPAAYAVELERHRKDMKQRSPDLGDDERKIIQHYRLFSEEDKKELRNFTDYLASKKKGAEK